MKTKLFKTYFKEYRIIIRDLTTKLFDIKDIVLSEPEPN